MEMALKTFKEMIELSKDFNLGFVLEQCPNEFADAIKMTNHFHPWSMREEEAGIVYDIVTKNNLQKGFEVATAFGISSAVAGQGFKQTGGKLLTLDAYVEETVNHCGAYDINTRTVQEAGQADGYKMASTLHKALGIDSSVSLAVGWSPDAVPDVIEREFGANAKLDYLFIDGGHSFEQIHADTIALIRYMGDNCVVFYHDFQCAHPQTRGLMESLGFKLVEYKTGFALAAYFRGTVKP